MILVLALATAGFLSAQTVFRSNVRLVRILATVKDVNGNLVGSLGKADFRVYDNGVEQQIAVFDRESALPLSVAILVDTSASTGIDLKYETDSVNRFLKTLLREGNPDDQSALYSFNWQVTLQSFYTRRLERLEQVLRRLKSEGGTSMYDAIYLASQDLGERNGRHVMIIVTDGGDTTSSKSYHQALEAAQIADSILYPILVMPITNDAGRNIGGENALQTLASSTGGRVFAPSIGAELDRAFAEILRDLRTQYVIGFYPKGVPATKDRFHRLKIALNKPGLLAQYRTGYYGDSEASADRGAARFRERSSGELAHRLTGRGQPAAHGQDHPDRYAKQTADSREEKIPAAGTDFRRTEVSEAAHR
jgi:Ca-activated chloride channel family protein